MLLAFDIAEVRDYFVDGHLDQGAQLELDGADRASARRHTHDAWSPDPEILDNSLEAAVAAYSIASAQLRSAEEKLEAYILPRIALMRAKEEIKAAVALRNALPMGCFAKTAALQDLMPVNAELVQRTEPATLNAELATLLLAWQRAQRRERPLSDALTRISCEVGQKMLDEGRGHDLPSFAESLPSSWARAMLMDMARYGKPRSDDTTPGF